MVASVEPGQEVARKENTEEPTNAAPAARAPPTRRTAPTIRQPYTH